MIDFNTQAETARPDARRLGVRRRLRVVFLDHTAKLGGGEIALLNLVDSIDRRRYEPVVLLFSDGPLKAKLENRGVAVVVRALDPHIVNARKDLLGGKSLLRLLDVWRTLEFAFSLSAELRSLQADLVHTNSLKSDLIGGLAARFAGVPLVWHLRDRIAGDYLPPSVAWVFRLLAHLVPDRVIVNSSATLQTLWPHREIDAAQPVGTRFQVVHDGTNVIDPAPVGSPATDGKFVIGLVGRIAPWKGQDIFLKAAAIVHQRFPAARFQIVGSAMFGEEDYDLEIRRLARALLPDNVVEFTGFREDVANLMGKMDVLVHASTRGEPFGQVILEGMAAGKAVVATRGGGVPEFVDDGRTGLLVPMGDAQAMADAISRFLGDPAFRAEAGARGRQRVQDHFTLQHTVRKVQSVFEDLLYCREENLPDRSTSRQSTPSISLAMHAWR